MNRVISVFICAVLLLCMLCVGVSAQDYSSEYPADASYNSGGPIWIHCRLQRMGEVLIILDPETNLESFGFDSPHGYNLINNTANTIKGRCYPVGGSTSYAAQFPSFYMLQLQTGVNSTGSKFYEDYLVEDIIGTTLNLIDYRGDRGNDAFEYEMTDRFAYTFISVCLLIIVFLLIIRLLFKPRMIRM